MVSRNRVLFLFSLIFFQDIFVEIGLSLMTITAPMKFLSSLLEASVNEINQIAKLFRFSDISEEHIYFILYLPSKKTERITSENVLNFINPKNPTKVIIHGWTNSATTPWVSEMAFLYHQKGEYNVIIPDWSKYGNKNYLYASKVTRSVGFAIGNFLLNVSKHSPDFLENVHLIGHSLGGQVAGFAGIKVSKSGKSIDRISGLDVAAPLFEFPLRKPSSLKISSVKSDIFVDLYHTNAYFYGVSQSYGDADFYINNGGPVQSGCFHIFPRKAISCSHNVVHEIFARTILNETMYEATSCSDALSFNLGRCNDNSKVYLGEGVSREARGPYYIKIKL